MRTGSFKNGKFVISLDFELFWGVRDKRSIDTYGKNIIGVKQAIPAILSLCREYDVRITFSTVGFLFAQNKNELLKYSPSLKPQYTETHLSPYTDMDSVGDNENDDPYHFGYSLLQQIRVNPQHEIGTHTFSHYYCLEPGQTLTAFSADLVAARHIGQEKGIDVRSLVFPRNQFNQQYLDACKTAGIESYRGNPVSWLYAARNKNDETLLRRLFRLADAYINITGHHCHSKQYVADAPIPNVAASRFLRPFNKKLSLLEGFRLKRITSSMKYAAKNKKLYHLWWHPHNFGSNLEENILFLKQIFTRFEQLREKYRFESVTMTQIAEEIKKDNG
jgi:peptidoglycan/xylan/chitin deacetylase (PgdA/CDA1 family)